MIDTIMKKFTSSVLSKDLKVLHQTPMFDVVQYQENVWTKWNRDIIAAIPVLIDQEAIVLERRKVSVWKTKSTFDESITALMSTFTPGESEVLVAAKKTMGMAGIEIHEVANPKFEIRNGMATPMSDLKVHGVIAYLKGDDFDERQIYMTPGESIPIKIPFAAIKSLRIDDLMTRFILSEILYDLKRNGLVLD